MKYEERLVVYIDILGFSHAIERTTAADDESKLEVDSICEVFSTIRKHWSVVGGTAKISQFSDIIVLSLVPNLERELATTFFMLQVFIFRMLHKGFLCRGVIKYGKLIHTDEYLFGPVLVEAYREERDLAKFPRIIIHPNVFQVHLENDLSFRDDGRDKILKDEDGQYYLDYFRDIGETMSGLNITDGFYCFTLWRVICEGLIANATVPAIRAKYEWMKAKYNEAAALAAPGTWYKQLPVNV